jgi:hypothetical protein
MSRTETDAILAAYDFSRFRTIMDVGGGRGALLAAILRANPAVSGVLVDLPSTVAGAGPIFESAGVADRCTVVGGSFFEAVPGAADLYLLKSVIHDWDDERAVAILRSCRQAVGESGRVMLVERVLPSGNAASLASLMDLNMLVLAGGQERTEAEYRSLYERAGLALVDVIPAGADLTLLEGVPVARGVDPAR